MPFLGRRVKAATVIWLNYRWFLERTIDLTIEYNRARVSSWLTDEFAFIASESKEHSSEIKTLLADRYGSSSGTSIHGGSGRVATHGCFQAKGVGPTPLVGSSTVSSGHSHGCMAVAECIREAIYSEIASVEFPHGAVSVIAILDLGMGFSNDDVSDRYNQNVRRGLLTRPTVVRPAHMERAPLFNASACGYTNVQREDVARTRDYVRRWHSSATSESGSATLHPSLAHFVKRGIEQIGFGQVHRLFSGGPFSSNLSINAELVDFGNMHALPDWARANVLAHSASFGEEISIFRQVVAALGFYLSKICGVVDQSRPAISYAEEHLQKAWDGFALEMFQMTEVEEPIKERLLTILRGYYRHQQRRYVQYRFRGPTQDKPAPQQRWLYHAIVAPSNQSTAEDETCRRISQVLHEASKSPGAPVPSVAWSTASRFLRTRDTIDHATIIRETWLALQKHSDYEPLDVKGITKFIDGSVGAARRHWKRLPKGLIVLAHCSSHGCSALVCKSGESEERKLWLEGITKRDGSLQLFQYSLTSTPLGNPIIYRDGIYWSALVPTHKDKEGRNIGYFASEQVVMPTMQVVYDHRIAKDSGS